MNLRDNFIGALTLRNETFVALRGKSDVFLRGFLVLLVAGLIVGVCAAVESLVVQSLPPPTQQEVIDIAVSSFRSQYTGPAAMAPIIESYVREVASLVYEIISLPPPAPETLLVPLEMC